MNIVLRAVSYTGVNAAVLPFNLATAWILSALGVHYLLATAAGFILHVVVIFFVNRRWTFDREDLMTSEGLVRTAIIHGLSFCVAMGTVAVCVEYYELQFMWARVIAVAVCGMWDYMGDSFFTFRRNPFR
ncbi:GtrA family protein [Acetobacteraceae bacterium]|nr:GtrA family protein [Candidatus Parcubacteria bacterium]